MEKKKSERIKEEIRVGKLILHYSFLEIDLERAQELVKRVSKPSVKNSVSGLKQYLPSWDRRGHIQVSHCYHRVYGSQRFIEVLGIILPFMRWREETLFLWQNHGESRVSLVGVLSSRQRIHLLEPSLPTLGVFYWFSKLQTRRGRGGKTHHLLGICWSTLHWRACYLLDRVFCSSVKVGEILLVMVITPFIWHHTAVSKPGTIICEGVGETTSFVAAHIHLGVDSLSAGPNLGNTCGLWY